MLLDFQIETKSRAPRKEKTKHTGAHVSYTYLYIFHVQSYIPNPRDSIVEINTELTVLLTELLRIETKRLRDKRDAREPRL